MSHHDIGSQVAYALVEDALTPQEKSAYKDANHIREELEVAHYAFGGAVCSGAKNVAYTIAGAGIGVGIGGLLSLYFGSFPPIGYLALAFNGAYYVNILQGNRVQPFRESLRLLRKAKGLESELRVLEGFADYQSAVGKVESKSLVL